jgi:hypothetical protein
MPDVRERAASCLPEDELKDSGNIVIGVILESEVPELFVVIRVKVFVLPRELIASNVVHPDVIPIISEFVRE